MGFLGFSLIQATKATGIAGHIKTFAAVVDTSINNDSLLQNIVPLNDPKQGFTTLFTTAVTGDGANGARLNPMAITFVENYIARNRKGFLTMKEWARPYLEMMDAVLTQHGLPKELKYLAVIESGLKYNALSWSGAVGPWALMPAAAKAEWIYSTRFAGKVSFALNAPTKPLATILTRLIPKLLPFAGLSAIPKPAEG